MFPGLYLFNELATACLKLLLGNPTQISVRLSYQVPHKTPATSLRKTATRTLQSHSSRDSSEGSGSTVVRLHNELPESESFVSGNGNNNFSCRVYTQVLRPSKSSVQRVVQIFISKLKRADLQHELHPKPNSRICGPILHGVVVS